MSWPGVWILVLAVGLAGLIAALNRLRFERSVAREVRQMWAGSGEPPSLATPPGDDLPPPVRRYATRAIAGRGTAIRTARLRHRGTLRTALDGPWRPVRGEQYFSAAPPAFVWWGRVALFPGLWVDVCDRLVDGAGQTLVVLESTLTLGRSAGPAMDLGALHRVLGEMAWFPTAFLDRRYVTWTPVDEGRARATLRSKDRAVEAVFEFGEDGLPLALHADRHRDLGGGQSVPTPWTGEFSDYREVQGVLAPHRVEASWHVGGRRVPVVRFEVERLEYDVAEPS